MSKDGEETTDVVEIDAIGAEEWERDQHTPQAIESNLAALVKQSASSNSGPVRTKQLDDGWDENAEAAKPRTTTNTLRRTGAAPAVPLNRKTQAMGTPIMRPAVAPVVVSATPVKKPAAAAATTSGAATAAKLGAAATTSAKPTKPTTATKPSAKPTTSAAKPATAATTPAKSKATDAAASPAAVTNGWVAKPRATSQPSVDPTFAPFSPPFAAPAKRPPTPQPMAALSVEPAKPRPPTPQPMAALSVEPAKPRPPTPQPMAALKARAPTPPPMPALAIEPAKSRAPTPPPMPAMSSEPTKVLAPSSASDFAAADAARDWADPTQTGVRMPPETALPATPTKARAPTPQPMVVKQSLELPAWPPRSELALRASEPDMLPPPPAAGFEDWENPNANTSLGNRVQPQSADPASDFKREDSVIIDLNAVARESGAPRRPQTYPVIQTSEQSTTTSGVFVMPTADAPKAVEAPLGTAHVATPAPTMPEPAHSTSPFQRPSSAWHTPLPQTLPGQPTAAPPVPSFPSAAGLLDDVGAPAPLEVDTAEPTLARRTLLATVFPTPQRRRTVLLVAGGSLGLMLVLILAFSGASHAPKTEPPTALAKPTTSTTSPSTSTSAASTPSHAAAAQPVAVATTNTVPDKLEAPAQPTKKPVAKRRSFRAKKPVVLDYDKKQDPTPSQDEALARARAAYATGNQHLFAGQADAAIVSYNQALADYPSYVAGYRGLGLAYAQQGNRGAALTAFKTYVSLAPNAKDVALIEKRISRLSIAAR
jgi:hypothetical protein